MAVILILCLCLFFLVLRAVKSSRKTGNLPGPSPFLSLPFVGHAHLLGSDPIKGIFEQRKKYGDVFRLDIGQLPTVFLCDWKVISEAAKSELVSGRPYGSIPSFPYIRKQDSRGNLDGPSVSNGKVWHEQRRFMLQNLNDLGMANSDTMESIISQEAEYLAQRMMELTNQKLHIKHFFLTTSNNVIWRLITGKSTKQDDPELMDLTARVSTFFKTLDPSSLLNVLQLSSVAFMKISSALGITNAMDTVKPMYDIIEQQVKGKAEDPNGDFIERCWAEIGQSKDKEDSNFHGKDGYIHMVGQMFDFFVAGTDTVATFVEWSILYLCQYPEVQDRVHQEIRDCFGTEGSISLKDNFRVPYVEATIEEIGRHSPASSFGVPHLTVGDVSLGGFSIPKGTQVYFFGASVHMDPKLFDNPEEFNPSRFLDKNGGFKKNEHSMFFGQGKRRCPGERLGRAECFLLFATLFQKFRFTKVKELDFKPESGLLFYPKPFDVIVEKRC